jgi:hypothetical protein
MPTQNNENIAAVTANWTSVKKNYKTDLAAAEDDEQRTAITENRRAAELAYLDAVRKGLSGSGMAEALAALKEANAAVKKSREKGEAIGKLLAKATTATEKATELVAKAGGG